MTLRESYLADVEKNITAHPEQKNQFLSDLRTHFVDGKEAGETDVAVIDRLGQAEDVAAEFMANIKLPFSGFWERTLAFFIDMTVCIYAMIFMYGLFVCVPYLLMGVFSSRPFIEVLKETVTLEMLSSLSILLIPLMLLVIIGTLAIFLLYFPILETRFGQTLGKRMLGIRVLKERKTSIGMKEAFIRRLSYYVDILFLDALFIPFTEKKQRAFDIVAKTVVVRDPSYQRNFVAIFLALAVFAIPFFVLLGVILMNDPEIMIKL